MHSEQWKLVVGFEGLYEVSDLGRVRSMERDVLNRWGSMTRKPTKVMALIADKDGYHKVNLYKGKACVMRPVHQVVLEAFMGPRPDGMQTLHKDGSKTNNAPSNLAWGTALENSKDRKAHGTGPNGERNPKAKLTVAAVELIREDTRSGERIGQDFGVDQTTISSIKCGKTWAAAGGVSNGC